jgi:hypothetical protein
MWKILGSQKPPFLHFPSLNRGRSHACALVAVCPTVLNSLVSIIKISQGVLPNEML